MAKVKITIKDKKPANKELPWNWNYNDTDGASKPRLEVNKVLQPVPRKDANIEVEKKEVVVSNIDNSGIPSLFVAGGKPHSQGGTPLNLPDKSFVFSKDKSMAIKDPTILKMFVGGSKASYVPAEIAKRYDINEYRKTLADKDADKLQKSTAEMMIANYNEKLGKLALIQESHKGFPNGIPAIALPYMESANFNPADMFMRSDEQEPDANEGRYGGAVHKYQMGGGVPTYDPAEKQFFSQLAPGLVLPEDMVEAKQKKQNSSTFGRFNPEAANKNWAWLGKKIDWSDPAQVGQAQQAYNTELKSRFVNAGYTPQEADRFVSRIGFVGNAGVPNSLDSKAGKYTETRVLFDVPKKTVPEVGVTKTDKGETAGAIPREPSFDIPAQDNGAPFWLQDVLKTAGAYGDMTRINKYMPWQATYQATTPTPTFYDPTRQLAANAEQAAIASQATAMYAGPQAAGARLSAIQGQAASNAANILGKYDNLNVGVANQFEQQRAGILNQASMQKAREATNLYDKVTIANQQFDNAKAMARQNLRQSYLDAVTNRAQTQALNQVYPQYNIDPVSGGLVKFTQGRALNPSMANEYGIADRVQSIIKRYPALASNPELAYKIATGAPAGVQDDKLAWLQAMLSQQH